MGALSWPWMRGNAEEPLYELLQSRDLTRRLERDDSNSLAIERLQGRLENVVQVIGVIAGISKQTNLLSLNAAIEAARAGVHGQGFAVVAEEVRRLALHTTESTEQVANIVEGFRGEMAQLAQAGQDMQGAVVAGQTGVKTMRSELTDVSRAMDQLDQRVGAMATGTAQIGQAIGDLNRDVHTVADTAASLLDSAQRIGDLGQSVHGQSDRLLEGLGGFQLALHQQARAAVEQLTRAPELRGRDLDAIHRLLRQALDRDATLELVYLVAPDGQQLSDNVFSQQLQHLDGRSARGTDWSQRHWFRAVKSTGQAHISDVYRSSATDDFCFTVAVPIHDEQGQNRYILGADVRLSALIG